MKKVLYTMLLGLTALWATAQDLPHVLTEAERLLMDEYLRNLAQSGRQTPQPPPVPVRTMAEWEEIDGLVITWTSFPSILTEIVRAAVPECTVYIVTQNPGTVSNQLSAAGVPLGNVQFINAPFNSVWIRDYGPWAVYQHDVDSLNIVDWLYNRPRPLDDAIPAAVANTLGLPLYEATLPPDNLVHTGGNHLHDGMGTAYSSDLLFDENPGQSEADLARIVSDYLGVSRHIKMRRLPFDVIHHVDMHIRNLDEETMFVARYPDGVADGPQINANVDYLRSHFRTAFGNTYNVVRMDSPPGAQGTYPHQGGPYRTYTNALFLNKTIIVPIYETQYDTVALRMYREQLPGYNVVGIDCNAMIGSLGALHCITKTVGVREPLWIAHPRLRDTYQTDAPYPVRAIIKHRSGIADATLHYRTQPGADYAEVAMLPHPTDPDTWTSAIPAQPAGTEVQYYIHAEAVNGKVQVRPLVAPEGYFRFRVKGPQSLPVAAFLQQIDHTCPGGTVRFTDDSSEATAWLWNFPGGTPPTSTEQHPEVTYSTTGVYDVSLTVTNTLGTHTLTRPTAVTVHTPVAPFSDDFTDGPNPAWIVDNPDGDATAWTVTSTACHGNSFRLANHTPNLRFTRDYFRALVDLSSLPNPQLTFDVAYARRVAGSRYDALWVNVIRCDGDKHTVFNKSDNALATVPATNSAFTPPTCAQWRNEVVDLSAFSGETVWIEFENVNGWGNNLYIDNIQMVQGPNTAPLVAITSPEDGTFLQVTEPPTLPITATATDPDGTVAQVAFYVDGALIGEVSAPPYTLSHTFPATGTYLLTAAATDNSGATTLSDPVAITIELTVGTGQVTPLTGVAVFPNPVGDRLQVRLASASRATVGYGLLDVLGRTVQAGQWEVAAGVQQQQLDLSALPPGAYTLRLHGAQWQQVWKVLRR